MAAYPRCRLEGEAVSTEAGKNEVAGILTKDVLRTSWLYRMMERTVEWMQRWL